MTEKSQSQGLRVVKNLERNNDGSVEVFITRLAQFDQAFCNLMASGNEFTARIEVRGDKGKLVHCRFYHDEIERPGE